MPSLHADVESSEMELGIFHQSFEDKRFMQKLGVYATIRPDNLKNTVRTNGHESLSALLQNWRQGRVTENVEEREPEQLELRDYEMVVIGKIFKFVSVLTAAGHLFTRIAILSSVKQ